MKPKLNLKVVAMMAACALVAGIGNARAQGMPDAAQQVVQTMRPMEMDRDVPGAPAPQPSGENAYGGAKAGTSVSAAGRSADTCRSQPRCDVFFGH